MSDKKPLIGVTTAADRGHLMWKCTRLGIRLAGGKATRITISNRKDYTECDGYLISGGSDIDPINYQQENTHSIRLDSKRDALEKAVILHALEHKKPLMGICRGVQMINVVQGGTLHQEARDFYKDFIPTTGHLLVKIFSRRVIHIDKDSTLNKLLRGESELSVNSIHHQAIDRLGDRLKIVAKDDLGMVQAIEGNHPELPFLLGVQWHPEFMLHGKPHRRLFQALVEAASEKS